MWQQAPSQYNTKQCSDATNCLHQCTTGPAGNTVLTSVIYRYTYGLKAAAAVILAGHIGFLGRSGVFLFVAILMFRTIKSPDINSTDVTTIGNALSQLQKTQGGKASLFILGFLLLVYGTFAVSYKCLTVCHGCQVCLSKKLMVLSWQ